MENARVEELPWPDALGLARDSEVAPARFSIQDDRVRRRLSSILSRLAGPADLPDDHALIAEIVASLFRAANDQNLLTEQVRAVIATHVDYHRAVLLQHIADPVATIARGIPPLPHADEGLRHVETSVKELLQHSAAAIGMPLQQDEPSEMFTFLVDHAASNRLIEAGVWFTTTLFKIWSHATFEPTLRVGHTCDGFGGRMGAFSFSNSKINPSVDSIGRYCSIAAQVAFGETEHPLDRISTSPFTYDTKEIFGMHLRRTGALYEPTPKPDANQRGIVIGNDVWIGWGCYFRVGVTIGDGAVIGAHSVVTRDIEPFTIVAGAPARPLRRRFPDALIERIAKARWWDYEFPAFNGLPTDRVPEFLDGLERMVADGTCKPYRPQKLTGRDIARIVSGKAPAR